MKNFLSSRHEDAAGFRAASAEDKSSSFTLYSKDPHG